MILAYLFALIVAFAISAFVSVGVIRKFEGRLGDRVQDIHVRPLVRYGGIAFVVAILVTLFVHTDLYITRDLLALLAGMMIIVVVGFVDDRSDRSARAQLMAQLFGIAVFLWWGGIRLDVINIPWGGIWELPSLIGLSIASAWLLLVMNAMNWLDGLDGLGPSVLLIGFVALAIVGALPHVYQPPLVIAALVGAGSIGALLVFNVPPALLLLGSGGVFGAAFFLGGLSIMAGGKLATTAIVLGIPLLDSLWVLWQRFTARAPLARGDTRHLHHAFLRAGFSPRRILLIYSGVTSLFAVVALLFVGPWRGVAAAVVVLLFFALVRLVGRRAHS